MCWLYPYDLLVPSAGRSGKRGERGEGERVRERERERERESALGDSMFKSATQLSCVLS